MRTPTNLVRVAAPLAAILVLSACTDGDGDEVASIDLSEQTAAQEADEPEEEEEEEDSGDITDAANAATGTTDGDVVDLTEAVPGTWPVGDAGTVTFSIVDGALILDDVTANDGWVMAIDEQDPDEIEIDFARGNVEWEIEIELVDDGRTLEIEIDQDIEPAEPGSYDIGDAGTFAFSIADGQLMLDDLTLAQGWTLIERDEDTEEIEFEVVDGPRSFDVEVELEDDGTIELEIDYEVAGPVTG